MRRRAQRITAINMREIQERRIGARWVRRIDRTLIKINRSGVKIRGIARTGLQAIGAIRKSQQFQIVGALLHTAAIRIAAVLNAAVTDLSPRAAAVQALPNPLIDRVVIRVSEMNQTYISFRPGTTVISPR